MKVEKETDATARNGATGHAGQRPDDRGRERTCAMLRHRRISSFGVLALALLLLGGTAAPALSAEHEVRVTATYGAAIEVAWPGDVSFGTITTLPYDSGLAPLVFTVTSNVAFTTTLAVTDDSTGGLVLDPPYVDLRYYNEPVMGYFTRLQGGMLLPPAGSVDISGGPGTGLVFEKALRFLVDPAGYPDAPITIQPGALDVGLLFTVAQAV
jgi:hypothetical protein